MAITLPYGHEAVARAIDAETERLKSDPRPLDEWHEDMGDVVWWALDENGEWLGEAAWIGTPLDLGRGYRVTVGDQEFVANLGGWPGYHTHWTPHPARPSVPTQAIRSPHV